jgi:hypothetical protein
VILSTVPTNDTAYTYNSTYASWGAAYYSETISDGPEGTRTMPYTFTVNSGTKVGIVLLSGRGKTSQVIKNFKLERGDKATSWTLSSHD